MFHKFKDLKTFNFTNEITLSRFSYFKERIFFLKNFGNDFTFYFPYISISNRININDDNILIIQNQFIKQDESYRRFLSIFKDEGFGEKIFSRIEKGNAYVKEVSNSENNCHKTPLDKNPNFHIEESKNNNFSHLNSEIPLLPVDSKLENMSISNIKKDINNGKINYCNSYGYNSSYHTEYSNASFNYSYNSNFPFNSSDSTNNFFNYEYNYIRHGNNIRSINNSYNININNTKHSYINGNCNSGYVNNGNPVSNYNNNGNPISNYNNNDNHILNYNNNGNCIANYNIDNSLNFTPFNKNPNLFENLNSHGFNKFIPNYLPSTPNLNIHNYNPRPVVHFPNSHHRSNPKYSNGFVYSCFRTIQFNSSVMYQNMENKAQRDEKTLSQNLENHRRRIKLKILTENKNITTFVQDVIDQSLSSENSHGGKRTNDETLQFCQINKNRDSSSIQRDEFGNQVEDSSKATQFDHRKTLAYRHDSQLNNQVEDSSNSKHSEHRKLLLRTHNSQLNNQIEDSLQAKHSDHSSLRKTLTYRHSSQFNNQIEDSLQAKHFDHRKTLTNKYTSQLNNQVDSSKINKLGKFNFSNDISKEVISDTEIYQRLNLQTFTFSDLPENPIKIAEASFSEVFRIQNLIFKIIPFTEWYGLDSFCKEVFVLECLKNEPGVCRLENRFLLKGPFSQNYISAWENFPESENAHPSEYGDEQVYGVLVMQDCGVDLEKFNFDSYFQLSDFIDQLLCVICRLENKFKFEHRDMHWGNVMIRDSSVYLVDFNFSRLETDKIVYTDLNNHSWIFEGDTEKDIQFGVYKEIRDSCNSNWESFNPKSNLYWIKYILQKLISKANLLKRTQCKAKAFKILKKCIKKVNLCSSCIQFYEWFDKMNGK